MKSYYLKSLLVFFILSTQSACVGKVIDAAVDTTISVAKVPFKVAGAAVDVVAGDGKKDKDKDKKDKDDDKESDEEE